MIKQKVCMLNRVTNENSTQVNVTTGAWIITGSNGTYIS